MGVGYSGHVVYAARIEKMQDRKRRLSLSVNTAKAVPESAAGHRGNTKSGDLHLAMELIQAIDGQLRQLFGIGLCASIRSRADPVRELCSVTLHLAGAGVEKESANRGTAGVNANDERIARRGAHGEFPL